MAQHITALALNPAKLSTAESGSSTASCQNSNYYTMCNCNPVWSTVPHTSCSIPELNGMIQLQYIVCEQQHPVLENIKLNTLKFEK